MFSHKPGFDAERAPWRSSGRATLPRVRWRPARNHRPAESHPRAQLIPTHCSLPHPPQRRIQSAPTRRSMPGMPAPHARQTTGHRHHARARNRRCRIFPDLDAKVASHQNSFDTSISRGRHQAGHPIFSNTFRVQRHVPTANHRHRAVDRSDPLPTVYHSIRQIRTVRANGCHRTHRE